MPRDLIWYMTLSVHMCVLLKRHDSQAVEYIYVRDVLVQNTSRATGSCEILLFDSRSPEDIYLLCLELFK
jgi:hypothetical protein